MKKRRYKKKLTLEERTRLKAISEGKDPDAAVEALRESQAMGEDGEQMRARMYWKEKD